MPNSSAKAKFLASWTNAEALGSLQHGGNAALAETPRNRIFYRIQFVLFRVACLATAWPNHRSRSLALPLSPTLSLSLRRRRHHRRRGARPPVMYRCKKIPCQDASPTQTPRPPAPKPSRCRAAAAAGIPRLPFSPPRAVRVRRSSSLARSLYYPLALSVLVSLRPCPLQACAHAPSKLAPMPLPAPSKLAPMPPQSALSKVPARVCVCVWVCLGSVLVKISLIYRRFVRGCERLTGLSGW